MVKAGGVRAGLGWLSLSALVACAPLDALVLVVNDSEPEPEFDAGGVADATVELDAQAVVDGAPSEREDTRGSCRIRGSEDGFYETFAESSLDPARWLVAHGQLPFAGRTTAGGFSRDNVSVEDGALVLRVRGDRYTGPVRGVDASGQALADGRRTGAALVTRDLFGSGTYQVEGHFVGPQGVEFAVWFMGDDDSQGSIDIAAPGQEGELRSYQRVRMRSRSASQSSENQFLLPASLDDGAGHIVRFDWYTTAMSAVRFWVDDEPRWLSDQVLPPPRAGRMWIVAWLPGELPADFESAEIRIENTFVTPFGNAGDSCQDGELSGPGLVPPR